MWKLKEIYAQNICAFRELHYHLKQGVTTLVFGDNRDNESQRSNGSGKSALIECIAIGITGSPLRKVKIEEIINDNSDESLLELTFANELSREQFVIERKLYRKLSAEVACYIFRNGEFHADEAIQPGIEAYNRFILEVLGITKDELFNSFILSKHRYQDFLSCPDKDKKDIINRFSNGNMVDQAIAEIVKDKTPVTDLLRRTELEYAGIEGKKAMLTEQIQEEKDNTEEKNRSKEERIKRINETITGKEEQIRQKTNYYRTLETEYVEIQEADKQIQLLEKSDCNLEEHLSGINRYIPLIATHGLSDWDSVINLKKKQVRDAEHELTECTREVDLSEKEFAEINGSYLKIKHEFENFIKDSADKAETYGGELRRLNEDYSGVLNEVESLKKTKMNLSASVESLNNKLAGVINCPSCGFEFLVSDKNFDVNQGRIDKTEIEDHLHSVSNRITSRKSKLQEIEEEQRVIEGKSRSLKSEHLSWSEKILLAEKDVSVASIKNQRIKNSLAKISDKINQLHSDIDGILRKVYDEAFEIVDDAYKRNERNKRSVCDEIKACESSIETLCDSIKELEETTSMTIMDSLLRSLGEVNAKSTEVFSKKLKLEDEIRLYERQEQNFTEFKTYLANSKIEALTSITNEFLENIGSDIKVKISGYTVLKSGKVREKISVSIIRSGIDCGSFGKFSAGETARVNLATILAMQKLINSNCNDDKGLDLLVLDEILEAVDEEGLSFMFNALNNIGVTALVVSHGNIAESYPHTIKIIKENGESIISEDCPY